MIESFIDKQEGRYYITAGHFAIDCRCGGDKLGSRYKNAPKSIDDPAFDQTDYYLTTKKHVYKHTYYINIELFSILLDNPRYTKESPLVIECKKCKKDFSFTLDSFNELWREISRDSFDRRKYFLENKRNGIFE